eukprot:6497733-Prymnesium_polylepis.1
MALCHVARAPLPHRLLMLSPLPSHCACTTASLSFVPFCAGWQATSGTCGSSRGQFRFSEGSIAITDAEYAAAFRAEELSDLSKEDAAVAAALAQA